MPTGGEGLNCVAPPPNSYHSGYFFHRQKKPTSPVGLGGFFQTMHSFIYAYTLCQYWFPNKNRASRREASETEYKPY